MKKNELHPYDQAIEYACYKLLLSQVDMIDKAHFRYYIIRWINTYYIARNNFKARAALISTIVRHPTYNEILNTLSD